MIGAGIVGASAALWAQADGQRVLLLDRLAPGGGTSYGNACTVAHYACIPINSPGIYRRLPRLLFGRDSPLRMDWRYALTHPGWQVAFLRNCSKARVARITEHLGSLLTLVNEGMDPLVERSGAGRHLADETGLYYVFSSESAFESARADTETRRRHGSQIVELSGQEFHDLEPNIRLPMFRALSFQNTRFLKDPQALIQCYVDRLVADGGRFTRTGVSRVRPGETVSIQLEDRSEVSCRKLVVAAGAWSRSIRGSGAEDLPLDTERGYHVVYRNHGGLVRRPVAWAEGGFYAVPTAHGLRLAGTVELAGLDPAPSRDRLDYLARKGRELFGEIGGPDDDWLGFRPTFPDALPVIGASHRSPDILFAFGHHHIGITLGGATGKLIADLLAGRTPPIDLSPFSAQRFLG